MKKCIKCAEMVQDGASVCRFCGHDFVKAHKAKRNGNIIAALVGSVMFVCLCLVLVGGLGSSSGSSAAPTPFNVETAVQQLSYTPMPTTVPTSMPTEYVLPAMDVIYNKVDGMTDAQRNLYLDGLVGGKIEGWSGIVMDVDEGEIFGGFTVVVDVLPNRLSSEVHINVDENTALSLTKGQTITFSGYVSSASDLFGVTLFMDDAHIH